jgi:hypothetical protein
MNEIGIIIEDMILLLIMKLQQIRHCDGHK